MVDIAGRDVPFQEAIGFFRDKVRLPTRSWTDLWQGMHARAFVVAGAQGDSLIADFQQAIAGAIEQGTTLADFRKDFDRIVAAHGWSYNGSRGWRSRIIFETNLRTAYMAGRWAQMQRVKAQRPYLRYVHLKGELHPRPWHLAWDGLVLPIDDPWWQTHYPPNGWNCHCSVQQLSARDLKRYGFEVSKAAPATTMVTKTVNTAQGPATVRVPEGIDPGWAYNVGEAAFGRGAESLALEAHGGWDRMYAPGGSLPADPGPLPLDAAEKVEPGPRARSTAGLRQLLRDALGGDGAILEDPAGGRVAITGAFADHLADSGTTGGREAFFPAIRPIVERPQEIWAGFARHPASGRYVLRRRYVKAIDAGRGRLIALVADADAGMWSGLTFFPAQARDLDNLRWGLRIYAAPR